MMTIGKKLHEKVKPHAKRIAGIAHPHRLAILYLLAHDPMWVRGPGKLSGASGKFDLPSPQANV